MIRYFSLFLYWFKAKKRHNIHSPFVYELSDRALEVGISQSDNALLNTFKKTLRTSEERLEITDFGAGSKKLSNQRLVREIFEVSRSKKQYAKFLFQLTAYYKPKRILELGTSLAWGTIHLHLGNPQAHIDTIEGCPSTHKAALKYFPVNTNAVKFHQMTFESYFEKLEDEVYDLIFIDGNHRGAALIQYVDQLFKHSHDQTIWILDDIRWSEDMWLAWNKIIEDKRFHVSIDFQRVGMVVRRNIQEKEHFFLRL